MLPETTSHENATQVKTPEDLRGEDDSLYLIYTVEELRLILREMGITDERRVKSSAPGIVSTSRFTTGNGVVLSLANNPDEASSSIVYVMGGLWTGGIYGQNEGDYDQECCVTQSYRRGQSYESVYARFGDLPIGRHTYALGFGYDIQCARIQLKIYRDSWRIKNGEGCLAKIPIKGEWLFEDSRPLIGVFSYDTARNINEIRVSLEVSIPSNFDVEYSDAWFHHIQLVQID